MKFVETGRTSGKPIKLFYEDLGSGKPVVLIHGWPLNHEMWEYQLAELPRHGIRCIAYDRRGFGKSDKPWDGYDYDTLAEDLHDLLVALDLEKVILVGFSMGGGEIARYIGNYGTERISKVVFIGSVTPYMLKASDNPEGIDRTIFDDIIIDISGDRPAFLSEFGKKFYGVGMLKKPVSDEMLHWTEMLGLTAGVKATKDCVRSFSETDFREDLRKIDVPALIIHGDMDKIVPFDISGKKTDSMIQRSELKIYHGAPHGLFITEKIKLNSDLVSYINAGRINNEEQGWIKGPMDLSQSFNL